MSLDQCIEFISEGEFVEVTPESIRISKSELNATQRALSKKKEKKT
jgi:GTP-binding protein